VSRSSSVVRITGIALGWIGSTTAFGAVVRKPQLLDRRRYRELSAEGFVCRVDRLRDRLGIDPRVDLEEGLRQTAAWYRGAGWI